MTTLTIELPAEIYNQLAATARQQRKPVEILVGEWLAERSIGTKSTSERERGRAALRAAGLLIVPQAQAHSNQPLINADRVALAEQLSIPGATPLSQLIIAEREERT